MPGRHSFFLTLLACIAGVALLASCGGGDGDSPGAPAAVGDLRQSIHDHAEFLIFVRGERLDFSDPKFVSTAEKELSPNVHIHEPRYTVVHIHRESTTWDELLLSLGFELTDVTYGVDVSDTCLVMPEGEELCNTETETFKFVANGIRVDGIASETISGLTRLLISYGSESSEEVQAQYEQVTDESCIPSGLCTDRGDGSGEHGEPCARADGVCN